MAKKRIRSDQKQTAALIQKNRNHEAQITGV